MKPKVVLNLLGLIIIFCFCAGITRALIFIIKNQYVQHKMYMLIALALQESLNNWSAIALAASLALLLLFFLLRLVPRLLPQLYTSRFLQNTKTRVICTVLFCTGAFLYGGWAINHYFLPDRFHPVSLTADAVFFLFIVITGYALLGYNLRGLRLTAIAAACFVVLLNIFIVVNAQVQKPAGPNILFIVVDSLRPKSLGYNGYPKNTSPFIDQLSRQGILFKNAYSNAPWTKPSVASMFTSQYPSIHGVTAFRSSLPSGCLTLAEILRNNGYDTAFFNENNFQLFEFFNFAQGFNQYSSHLSTEELTGSFLSYLTEHQDKRFFAYLHYMTPHQPYKKNKYTEQFVKKDPVFFDNMTYEMLRQSEHNTLVEIKRLISDEKLRDDHRHYLQSRYDSEVRLADENIQKIVSALEDQKILKETVIILTADHGEEFWEHGNYEHGHSLYNELLHVPLMLVGEQFTPTEIADQVQLIDIFPTVLELAKVQCDGLVQQGRGLFEVIEGRGQPRDVFAGYTLYGNEKYCLIHDNIKLIFDTGKMKKSTKVFNTFFKSSEEESFAFYDIEKDPYEKNKISTAETEKKKFSMLKKRLKTFKDNTDQSQKQEVLIDDSLKKKLSTLGYVE